MAIIHLPHKLDRLLNKESKDYKNNDLATIVQNNLIPFRHILEKSDLYFFPDYTDHSIRHVEDVLLCIENLITNDTLELLSPTDIGVLVTAVVLHDIGMLTSAEMFMNIISGKYDNITDNWFKNEKTWKELWDDYLKESQYWSAETRKNNTGDSNYVVKVSNKDIDEETDEETITYKIAHPLLYDERDKRFIGEFIRKYHARLAYEVALRGYIGNEHHCFVREGLPSHFMQLAGLIARSHGINVRDTFDILKKKFGTVSWNRPNNVKVILLMILVRLADLLQINPERTDKIMINLRTIYSPFSLKEHEMHLSIDCVQIDNDDSELIVVQATPPNAEMYVKIENAIHYIQYEFDHSWAILGEVYGNRYQLSYRRIISNITDEEVKKSFSYVPEQFGFKFNNSLPKLLIAPLYGDNPSFGVRELVQNAVDACRARMALDKDYNNLKDFIHVTVTLDPEKKLFRIVDSGIGMNLDDLEKYFLTIGSSYDRNIDWQKTRDSVNSKNENDKIEDINKMYRTGHFGIGILAAFLIGPIITVKTKKIKSEQGYEFSISLDKGFIQINKINESMDYGTCIEISECSCESLEKLEYDVYERGRVLGNRTWFGWYIDSKPKVDYIYKGQKIKLLEYRFKAYRRLQTQSSNLCSVYWSSPSLLKMFSAAGTRLRGPFTFRLKNKLYCNGFWITDYSYKSNFSIPGIELYLPFMIPNLKIIDTYNRLPLNLKRDNVIEDIEYSFEKDLAIALCKDYLNQMVAIDLSSFQYCDFLLFNKYGYTINQHPIELGYEIETAYKDKCLYGKSLVHIFYENPDLKYDTVCSLRTIMEKHDETFFQFNGGYSHLQRFDDFLRQIFNNWFNHSSIAVYTEKIERIFDDSKDKILKNMVLRNAKRNIYGYSILQEDSLHSDLLNDLANKLHYLDFETRPVCFIIHYIEGQNILSSLDEFINEYAGGNTLIPYDYDKRKEKFKKLFEECSNDIEGYKSSYLKEGCIDLDSISGF